MVAMKCMKHRYKSKEEVEETPEVRALYQFTCNQNIIQLLEVLYDEPTGRAALVFELMEVNLYEEIKDRSTAPPESMVKTWIFQVLKALDVIHRKGLFHRDIKPENILLMDNGSIVKLADFGSCKKIYSKSPFTDYISTRWYRSPECLMTDGYYNFKMDIWGLGCVFFEILTLYPLFPGDNEIDQLNRIHQVLGSPNKSIKNKLIQQCSDTAKKNLECIKGYGFQHLMSNASSGCIDLISHMIEYDSDKRLSASQALNHPYFYDLLMKDNYNLFNESQLLFRQWNASVCYNNHNHSMNSSVSIDTSSAKKMTIGRNYSQILPVINADRRVNLELDKQMKGLHLRKRKKEENYVYSELFFRKANEYRRNKQSMANISMEMNLKHLLKTNDYNFKSRKNKSNSMSPKKYGFDGRIMINSNSNSNTKPPRLHLNYISPYSEKIIKNKLLLL